MMILRVVSQLVIKLTSLHASWFIISLFGSSPGSGNKSFGKSTLQNSLSRGLHINSYLEPRMLYDVTDSGSFHGIDLEHLSDQVCYRRIFYMFRCFVNSSFNLKNKFCISFYGSEVDLQSVPLGTLPLTYLLKKFICIIIIKRECSTK